MQLNPDQLQRFEQIRQHYRLKLLLLHGSQVTGKTHPHSDVDIGIVRETESKLDLLSLIHELGVVFNRHDIDISDLTHADPLLLYAATQQAHLLAGTESDFTALQLKAFHRYQDYQPYLKQESELVRERLQKYVTS